MNSLIQSRIHIWNDPLLQYVKYKVKKAKLIKKGKGPCAMVHKAYASIHSLVLFTVLTSSLQDTFAVVGARFKQFKPWHATWFQDPVWPPFSTSRAGIVRVWIGFENLLKKEYVGNGIVILQGTQR